MDVERAREFLLSLPHVVETRQWGDNLVFWVGDKAVGGRMFALVDLSGGGQGVVSFAAGAERFHELLELDGLNPAPYFARIFWVSAERWSALRTAEWQELLAAAHALTLARLPPKTRRVLQLPTREQRRWIAERRAQQAQPKDRPKTSAKTLPRTSAKTSAKMPRPARPKTPPQA